MKSYKTLRDEAAQAGDLKMVAICDLALEGNIKACHEVERVLEAAAAMVDKEDQQGA
jgi:hypothetical protein